MRYKQLLHIITSKSSIPTGITKAYSEHLAFVLNKLQTTHEPHTNLNSQFPILNSDLLLRLNRALDLQTFFKHTEKLPHQISPRNFSSS